MFIKILEMSSVSIITLLFIFQMLFHYISKWPPIIYSIEAIINGILDKLDHDRNNRRLLETLGLLLASFIIYLISEDSKYANTF